LVNVPSARPAPAAAAPSLPAAAVDAGLGLLCLIRSELRERRPAGLAMGQFRLMHMVHRDADRSLSDFADDLGVSVPAASKMVDGLVERGLVARTADSADRRRLSLTLTANGVAVMREAKKGLEARVAEALAGLSAAEAANLAKALETLRSRLDRAEVLA
jgi:DNA-binding MarR family transcriptional regulator